MWLGEDERKFDHCRVHFQVLQDPRLGSYELATYLCLVMHAETQTGECFPAIATLAGYMNVSERTVQRAIARLTKNGYIGVKRRTNQASLYTVKPPPVIPTPASQSPLNETRGDSQAPPPRLTGTTGGDSDTDELEPLTRTKELAAYEKVDDGFARHKSPRPFCETCDGWLDGEGRKELLCKCAAS